MNDGSFVGILEGGEMGFLVEVNDDGVDGEVGGWGEDREGNEERTADDEALGRGRRKGISSDGRCPRKAKGVKREERGDGMEWNDGRRRS